MKILALDISSVSTGYSVLSNGRLLRKSCGLIQSSNKVSLGKRLGIFEKEIKSLIQKYKPEKIVIEDLFKGRNMLTFKILAMFRGVAIKAIYEEFGQDPISIMASQARSLVGIENQKEIAYRFVVEKYKLSEYSFNTHNDITDSIILGIAGQKIIKEGIDIKSLFKKRKKKRRLK